MGQLKRTQSNMLFAIAAYVYPGQWSDDYHDVLERACNKQFSRGYSRKVFATHRNLIKRHISRIGEGGKGSVAITKKVSMMREEGRKLLDDRSQLLPVDAYEWV